MPASFRSPVPEGPPGVPTQHRFLRTVHVSLVVSSSLSTPKPRQQHPVYANHVCLGNLKPANNGRRAWLWQAGQAVTQRDAVNKGCLENAVFMLHGKKECARPPAGRFWVRSPMCSTLPGMAWLLSPSLKGLLKGCQLGFRFRVSLSRPAVSDRMCVLYKPCQHTWIKVTRFAALVLLDTVGLYSSERAQNAVHIKVISAFMELELLLYRHSNGINSTVPLLHSSHYCVTVVPLLVTK